MEKTNQIEKDLKLVKELGWDERLYRMCDQEPEGPRDLESDGAVAYNHSDYKYGIFHIINPYKQAPDRLYFKPTANDITKIDCWAVDMDEGTKVQQWEHIVEAPIRPSLVVESKNGFHVYYFASDGKIENYKSIVRDRLVPYFKADKKATDPCRLLRTPGFNHWKDIDDPFMVRVVHHIDVRYTEEDMFYAFEAYEEKPVNPFKTIYKGTSVFDIDCERALQKLSGTTHVKSENYELSKTSTVNLNIIVDGKDSGCFISSDKRIPNGDQGPTAVHWLMWYGHSMREACLILEGLFPEYGRVQTDNSRDSSRVTTQEIGVQT